MERLNLDLANYRAGYELAKVEAELGKDWSIKLFSPLKLTPGKNYTAKADAQLLHRGHDVANIVSVLFKPGDSTGIKKWVPCLREGAAEFYIGLGSGGDLQWNSGLTSLVCFEELLDGTSSRFKHLATSEKMFLNELKERDSDFVSRFGTIFDYPMAEKDGFSYVAGFTSALKKDIVAQEAHVDYQIGSFVYFANQGLHLDYFRKAVLANLEKK